MFKNLVLMEDTKKPHQVQITKSIFFNVYCVISSVLGSRVFVQFCYDNELNFLDVKCLPLGNSIPFYRVLSHAVTTLPGSLRR